MRLTLSVSVVIPAFNSTDTLSDCLNALRDQTFRDFEVIVVNSSQEGYTAKVMEAYPEAIFKQWSYHLLPHAARNRGVEIARGDLLVFTDPDCRSHPDWLRSLVKAWHEGHEAIGGCMDLDSDSWFQCGVHLCKYWWALPGRNRGPCWILPTANAAYSRNLWNILGSFNGDHFFGDALLSWRAASAGFDPWHEPKAIVKHRHLQDLNSLWRQRVQRGQEFALGRMSFEKWSRRRAGLYVVLLPFLVGLVLLRAGRDSLRCGWALRFLVTLPVQIIGQTAWAIGESISQFRRLRGEP